MDHKNYQKGKELIQKELDLGSILDSVREINVLWHTLLDKYQQVLLLDQAINVIAPTKQRYFEYPHESDR